MKSRFYITNVTSMVLAFFWLSGFGSAPSLTKASRVASKKTSHVGPARPVHLAANYGQLPLAFEPNQGQAVSQVQYLAHGRGYSLFVTGQEAVLVLKKTLVAPLPGFPRKEAKGFPRASLSSGTSGTALPTVIRMKLEGAQSDTAYEGLEKLPGISNYFLGKDRSKWHTRIPQYGRVHTSGVFPGVDLAYYGNQGKLEYDFIVNPGADPEAVHLKFEGAKSARLNAQGDLELETSQGTLLFLAPSLYQGLEGSKTKVEGRYRLDEGGKIGFEVKDYDRSKPLVIDPVLDYSTFLGGSGYDAGLGIALDSSGDAYVTGSTNSPDFPVTNAGAPNLAGGQNAFVAEINPAGTAIIYATYLGGNTTDAGNGIAVDSYGDAFIVGTTNSNNFPYTNAVQAGPINPYDNVFVSELGPGGTPLLFSTYLGGSGNTYGQGDYGYAIALDSSGNVYVCGGTTSSDFPAQGAYQASLGTGAYANAFVAEINPATPALLYSTFLGGSYYDLAKGIAVDSGGNMFVTGLTYSPNFPVTNAVQSAFGGPGGSLSKPPLTPLSLRSTPRVPRLPIPLSWAEALLK